MHKVQKTYISIIALFLITTFFVSNFGYADVDIRGNLVPHLAFNSSDENPVFCAQYAAEHNKRVKMIAEFLVEGLKRKSGFSDSCLNTMKLEKWEKRLNSEEFLRNLYFVNRYHDIAAPKAMPKNKREEARASLTEKGVVIEGHVSRDEERYDSLRKLFFQKKPGYYSREEIEFALDYFQGPNALHVLAEQGFYPNKIAETAILFHHHRQELDDYLKGLNWTDEEKLDVLILTSIQVAADVIENGLNRFKPLYARNKEPDELPQDTREKWMDKFGIPQDHLLVLKDAFRVITDTDTHPDLKAEYWRIREDAKKLSNEEIRELDNYNKLPDDLKTARDLILQEDSRVDNILYMAETLYSQRTDIGKIPPQIDKFYEETSEGGDLGLENDIERQEAKDIFKLAELIDKEVLDKEVKEIYISASISLTEQVKNDIRMLKERNIIIRDYDSNNLKNMLPSKPDKIKRLFIVDDSSKDFLENFLKEDCNVSAFCNVRVLHMKFPAEYLSTAHKTFEQSKALMIAILARLLEEGKAGNLIVKRLLWKMIDNNMALDRTEMIKFINRVDTNEDNATTLLKDIRERIEYFLSDHRAINLVNQLRIDYLRVKEFWIYA
ncbi:MAG: hypothetical protein ABH883_03700 [Candidatus Omnitrophota bacterium]